MVLTMDKRITEGEFVPNGQFHNVWRCDQCEYEGSSGTGKAPDGSEGLFCYSCCQRGVTSPLKIVERESVTWVPGKVEVKCCGTWLECSAFTNTCDHCGRDFNHSGQELSSQGVLG